MTSLDHAHDLLAKAADDLEAAASLIRIGSPGLALASARAAVERLEAAVRERQAGERRE